MNATEVLLHQWALGVQFGTVALIALFFFVLARWVRLDEVRIWSYAWIGNAIGLAAALEIALGVVHPSTLPLALAVCLAGKTSYALLMVRGAEYHMDGRSVGRLQPAHIVLISVIWGSAVAILSPSSIFAFGFQWLVVGIALIIGATRVLRHPRTAGARWLGWVLLGAGVLYLHYIPQLVPMLAEDNRFSAYLDISPFFEAGAELVLALSTMVAIEGSTSAHLRLLNQRLIHSQDQLRQLVDLDPLTGLMNRRRLREVFEAVKPTGASVIFIDVDDFKKINDRSGHDVGDLCLQEFASVLKHAFRANDAIFRWGGDEFLIVAPGLDLEQARARAGLLRAQLSAVPGVPEDFSVSIGVSYLEPGGEPEAALRDADAGMYEQKRTRHRQVAIA